MRRGALALTLVLVQLFWLMPAAGAQSGFEDVPADHIFATEVTWLAERGITKGCNPPANTRFCPGEPVTRGQMAAFLVRAFGYSDAGDEAFADDAGVFQEDIRRLAAAGVTKGCNPPENTRFCPDDPVTRGQMAAFLSRAFGYWDEGGQSFTDDGGVFQSDIRKLAAADVTRGCNPPENTLFCPDESVTRGQMAAFLSRAFFVPGGVEPPPPGGDGDPTPPPVNTYPPAPPSTERVSLRNGGDEASSHSDNAAISGNGRYVVFESDASALVSNDTNGVIDIFIHDRDTGKTELVSVSSNGTQANRASGNPWVSDDGRYVTFASDATNLVSGDKNGKTDVFVRDRKTGTTSRASVSSSEKEGNGDSTAPAISADGRYVVFQSTAGNLAPSDGNGQTDVFIRDTQTGATAMVSRPVGSSGNANGGSGNAFITSNGRFVVFQSGASDLVPGDTNGAQDVFLRDMSLNATRRVSLSSSGAQGNSHSYGPAAISADGRFVAFESEASNLVSGDTNGTKDVFFRDLSTGATTLISRANGAGGDIGNADSAAPVISTGGQFVAFHSNASNLVSGDGNAVSDVFVRDTKAHRTERVSVATDGSESSPHSYDPSISADGRFVAFHSTADGLVPGDTNGVRDVFVRDRGRS